MKHFFKISFYLLAVLYYSCNDDMSASQVENRMHRTINLFPPKETNTSDSTDKLSFDEALAKSSFVFRVPLVQKVSSSNDRGTGGVYIYEAPVGHVLKRDEKKFKAKTIYFFSDKELFKGKSIEDSVYIFIEPLKERHILSMEMGIRYQWTSNAPFSD